VLTVSDLRDENTLSHTHQMRTNVGKKKDDGRRQRGEKAMVAK